MDARRKEIERMAKIYMEYLNGPIGKGVMGRLEEGEEFSIKTQSEIMRVKKKDGKAVVEVELKQPENVGKKAYELF
jgi:PP-loop superfamily ATP-utilizing enzyme